MAVKILKITAALALTAAVLLFGCLFMRGGDLLLHYLAKSMGVDFAYRSWCSSDEAFLCKRVSLKNVRIGVEDAPVSVFSDTASVSFDYSEFIPGWKIGLDIQLYKPEVSIAGGAGSAGGFDVSGLVPDFLVSDDSKKALGHISYIDCRLKLYGESVELTRLLVISDDIIITASGLINKDSSGMGTVEIFMSPSMLSTLPGDVKGIMDPAGSGWAGYSIDLANDPAGEYFKVESKRFRLEVGSPTR